MEFKPLNKFDDDISDAEEQELLAPKCGICNGPLVPLGALGNLLWCRCRNCGMESSQPVPPQTVCDEDITF